MNIWYLYKTTCLPNQKIYVGVHKAKQLNNLYIGCGVTSDSSAKRRSERKIKSPFVQAVVKYGYKNFKKEILWVYTDEDSAYGAEAKYVNKEWVLSTKNYNASLGGRRSKTVSKYHQYFGLWKNLYDGGFRVRHISRLCGLKNHSIVSLALDKLVRKRKMTWEYFSPHKAVFCVEQNRAYKSQREFLQETYGRITGEGNLSMAIKQRKKFKGLTIVRAKEDDIAQILTKQKQERE